jgi:uncharacterized membrane protein YphA (DoxX/SURF4 family)
MVRIVLGGLFLVSGIAKILDPIRFLFTLRAFRLLPGIFEPFLALFLPWLEVVLGLFILLGLFLRTCSLMLGCLNFLFMMAIVSVMLRGFEIDCGCFGLLADVLPLPDMADYRAVVRNLVLIGMCAYLYRSKGTFLSLDKLLINWRGGRESS